MGGPYWLDGHKDVPYETIISVVVSALETGDTVAYAFHGGFDCYWHEEEHPWHARIVELTELGLECNGVVLEPLETS